MKECPNCHKIYDDSWGVCLGCETPLRFITSDSISYIFEHLMTEFGTKFPIIFTPFDGFYDDWNNSEQRLDKMFQDILQFLRLENVTVCLEYKEFLSVPGQYECKNNASYIFINRKFCKSPFKVAAILAHEFMHHYFQINNLNHTDKQKNELLVDLATISAGLGILIINGMRYSMGSSQQKLVEKQESFGYFKPHIYCEYFDEYLKFKKISGSTVMGYIHPRAREFLPCSISSQKAQSSVKIIKLLESQYRRNSISAILKRVTIMLGIMLIIPLLLWLMTKL
jgi:hypothetical protein